MDRREPEDNICGVLNYEKFCEFKREVDRQNVRDNIKAQGLEPLDDKEIDCILLKSRIMRDEILHEMELASEWKHKYKS
jgi:hypothetical protein